MNKVDQTRDLIVRTSLALFNKKGYSQTSIQDIMEASGLPKGAIYRRFENKNEIALATFKHAGKIIWSAFYEAVTSANTATEKLLALCHVYKDAVNNPPIDGGCPLLNTAVESDYGFPQLNSLASEAYNETLLFMEAIIDEGIKSGEFREELHARSLASFIFSTIEGAIMASRLTSDNVHMFYSIEQIKILLQHYSMEDEE